MITNTFRYSTSCGKRAFNARLPIQAGGMIQLMAGLHLAGFSKHWLMVFITFLIFRSLDELHIVILNSL